MVSKLSVQYQTTIPSSVRKNLKIKPGNQLNWRVVKNKLGVVYAVVTPETKENIYNLKGIAKKMYKHEGGVKKHIKDLEASWSK